MCRQLYPPRDYPRGHLLLVYSLANLGFMHVSLGNNGPALVELKEALALQQQLNEAFTDSAAETEALNYLASLPGTRDLFLSATRGRSSPADAYSPVWAGRGLVVRLMERRHLDLRAGTDPEAQKLAVQLDSARQQLLHRLLHPLKDREQNAAEVRRLTSEKEDLERRIAQQLRLLLPATRSAGTPEQLCAALPADTVFVDLLRYLYSEPDPRVKGEKGLGQTPSFVAFVLSRAGVRRVELGPAEAIEQAVFDWRVALARQPLHGPDNAYPLALKVRQLVWEKLAQQLPPVTRVIYLAPDGYLTRLPWAALPGSRKDTILLEQYTVAVVPHGQFLLQQLTGKQPPAQPGPLLLAGNVSYDAAPGPLPGSPQGPGGSTLPERALTWPALPGTGRELERIKKLARGHVATDILSGDQATTAEVKKRLPQCGSVHLATHGFFAGPKVRSVLEFDEKLFVWTEQWSKPGYRFAAGARSPLVLSGLVFAGANQPDTPDKGILVAESIVGLDLHRMDLAVLSACETGLGDVAGGEGVYGLQRAFHVAGCQNVVASLWQVNDEATAALMQLFYQGLLHEKLPPIEALRAAQLSVYYHPEKVKAWAAGERAVDLAKKYKKTTTAPPAPAPTGTAARAPARLWAAFVLSGAGRPATAMATTPGAKRN
jgi:CHAT domain-containing protein